MTTPSDPPPSQPQPPYPPQPPQSPYQPPYQPPYQGQPAYQPPQPYPPQYPPAELLGHPAQPPRRRGRVVALAAAAVVVLGGGVATYAAVSASSDSGGAGTPLGAVQGLVRDLNNSDLLGLLDDLPPAERSDISAPVRTALTQLERTGVVKSGADLTHVSGIQIAANLTYGAKPIVINDHVQVVEVTGGTLTVSGDLAKVPFSAEFLRAIGRQASSAQASATTDIGAEVRRTGRPFRIAAQQVDGKWYPSLLYTIADNVVTSHGLHAPTAADRIPAVGADSPDAAASGLVQALVQGDIARAIELSSPDELAALHDYGKLIVDRVHYSSHAQIKDIQFADSTSGGVTRVSLKSVHVLAGRADVSVAVAGNCTDVTVNGQTRHFCSSDIMDLLGGGEGPFHRQLTAAQRTAISHLTSGATSAAGLVTVQVGGRWYVEPIRTYLDLFGQLLSGLQPGDVTALISIFRS